MSEEQRKDTEAEVEAHGHKLDGHKLDANSEPGDELDEFEAHVKKIPARKLD
jgi:hypothetical protein